MERIQKEIEGIPLLQDAHGIVILENPERANGLDVQLGNAWGGLSDGYADLELWRVCQYSNVGDGS